MEYTHGIPGSILTGQFHVPNGGISARFHRVTIVGPEIDGAPHLRPIYPDAPAVRIQQRTAKYSALVPVEPVSPGRVGYMASGAYVVKDGGGLYEDIWLEIFGHIMPVPLHDYSETWDSYNRNFD